MGQCYCVRIRFKALDEDRLVKSLKGFVREMESGGADFALGERNEVSLDALDGLFSVLFTTPGSESQAAWGSWVKASELGLPSAEDCDRLGIPHYHDRGGLMVRSETDADGFREFTSGFDAAYGWRSVVEGAFAAMARIFADGSELSVSDDDGLRTYRVDGGRLVADE